MHIEKRMIAPLLQWLLLFLQFVCFLLICFDVFGYAHSYAFGFEFHMYSVRISTVSVLPALVLMIISMLRNTKKGKLFALAGFLLHLLFAWFTIWTALSRMVALS